MCGIFALVGTRDDAAELVLKGLKLLEYRGYDSWGVAFVPVNRSEFIVEKHVGKIGDAELENPEASRMALGHTRWATHGGVTVANTHPHLSSNQEIALVHNGIIENYQTLKTKLLEKNYTFNSETDTEVVVYLIEEYAKKLAVPQAVQKAFCECSGLNALVVLNTRTGELIAVRRGSPLALGKIEGGFLIASDATAMCEHTNQVYFLEDNDLVVCQDGEVQVSDVISSKAKKIVWQKLEFSADDLSKGAYPHFMLKEIMEQPRVVSEVATQLGVAITEYATHFQSNQVFVGCGSSYHAALLGSYYFSLLAGRSVVAAIGSEFELVRRCLTDDAFVTFISQSGETIDLLEQLQLLQKDGRKVGAIVNRLGSSLERATTHKILMPAGPEQSVVATKSFIATVAILYLLAKELAGKREEGESALKEVLKDISELLTSTYLKNFIQPVAKMLAAQNHLFIIGRGISYPVALEAALKIKEVTYLHAEGFAGGELKHGVMALIEPGTPCIVFAPTDETHDTTISNAMEMKSRGARIIGVADQPNEIFEFYLPFKKSTELSPIPTSLVAQLIGYKLALLKGNDPDKPRNLAKSVTVK